MSEQASRREFLIAGAGTCAAAAAGCGSEMTNEPVGDPSYYTPSTRQSTMPSDNGMNMPLCGSTSGLLSSTTVVGSSLSVNQAVPISGRIVVCRDSKGLFALDLTCTHAGCQPALSPNSDTWI